MRREEIAELNNDDFFYYYKAQKLVSNESEWEDLVSTLRKDLPTTFRVVRNTVHYEWIHKLVDDAISASKASPTPNIAEGTEALDFGSLSWYAPYGEAYKMSISRQALRKNLPLKSFYQHLIHLSEIGCIFRQEAVSMIPAIYLMQIMNNDCGYYLDLCAAPGSKSSQLCEAMGSLAPKGFPRGVVVCNDLSSTRAHMLVNHLRHLASPALFVTTQNAAYYPSIWKSKPQTGNGRDNEDRIAFDGVLCDVPCSGDGTLRKAKSLWRRWTAAGGLCFHRLQAKILKKGLSLAKVGGRVVYSTCSLNPLENEAVVAGVLRAAEGSVKVVDCGGSIPGLKWGPGLQSWFVPSPNKKENKTLYAKFEEVPDTLRRIKLFPSMFPPSEDESEIFDALEKCQRFLPHFNDTGGFFVAVFQKEAEVPWSVFAKAESLHEEEPAAVSSITPDDENRLSELRNLPGKLEERKRVDAEQFKEWSKTGCDDILTMNDVPINIADRLKAAVFRKFGCKDDSKIFSHILFRQETDGMPKKLWICSDGVSRILNAVSKRPLHVVSAGCLLAEGRKRGEGEEDYRLVSSGYSRLTQLLGHENGFESDYVRSISRETALKLLNHNENIPSESDGQWRFRLEDLHDIPKEDLATLTSFPQRKSGILLVKTNQVDLPVFIGRHNVEILLGESSRFAFLCKLNT